MKVGLPVNRRVWSVLLLHLGLLLSFQPGWSQRLDRRVPQDTTGTIGRLPNGLRYYIRRNTEPPQRAELRLVVNVGSVLEEDDQRGLAHVVEHMAFNGTRRFPENALVNFLEGVGMRFGPDINASTDFEETIYTLTLPTDSAGVLKTGVQILADWAHGVTFDSLEVEKERPVVIEEWRLGQGAGSRTREKHLPVLFGDSRYTNRLPIGDRATLERFSAADLRRFYRDWYRPELMAVIAVGDFDPALMERWVRAEFSGIPRRVASRARPQFGLRPHAGTRYSIVADPEVTNSSVAVYQKRPARGGGTFRGYRDAFAESLAQRMLYNRLSELTQRPNAPYLSVTASQGLLTRSNAVTVLSADVRENGVERGLDAMLAELQRVARWGFTATELEREKRELLRWQEQVYAERGKIPSGQFAAQYVAHFLYKEPVLDAAGEYALYQRLVPRISLAQVNEQARALLRERNRVVLVEVPSKDSVHLPTAAALRRIIAAARRGQPTRYTDHVFTDALVPRLPQPGTIVARRSIPEIGVQEWTLANGARVVLKPTDFREDEILFAAHSPGGTSLAPDSNYIAALTATGVVQSGGVAGMDVITLSKRLAGKAASVGTDVGEMHEGLSGVASPKDIETLFQLIYLYFTAPRADSVAFRAYQQRAKAALANRDASPEQAFADTLRVTLAQGHIRARPPSSEMFDRMDMEKSMAFYRDRYADASDFTFYLVGRFDPDSLRPLVERYLGGLPAIQRKESWRDVGIRPPTGVIRKTVRRGTEPKARTQFVFTGPMQYSREELFALRGLADVLEIRLRETLREDLGGTYGVSVRASASREPRPEYRFSIGFGAAPERLDELGRAAFATIDSIKAHGPSESELAKVREAQRRAREISLRENNAWLGQLMAFDRLRWDPRGIMAEPTTRLDAAMIQRAARLYLNAQNYVQVSLVPETQP